MDELIHFDDHDAGGKVRITVPYYVVSDAVYSPCRQYRYILHRRWTDDPDHSVMFLMMNPSTATEEYDDPTVRKCRVYAMRWGYNHLIIGNVMAYRTTDPSLLRGVDDPIGPDNLLQLRKAIETFKPLVVCAWGTLPRRLIAADQNVRDLLRELEIEARVLHVNSSGSPGHPLYLPLAIDEPPVWNY